MTRVRVEESQAAVGRSLRATDLDGTPDSRMRRRAVLGGLLLAVLGLASACAGTGESRLEPLPTPTGPVPFAYWLPSEPGGDSAQLRGALVEEDGCLYVDVDATRHLPVFPAGAVAWDGSTLTTTNSRDPATRDEVGPGQEISLRGGGSDEEPEPGPSLAIPDACDLADEYFVVAAP